MVKSLTPVLVAGIGGASLGTEILKSLKDAGGYQIFGCDISEYAYGHYQEGFTRTFLVNPERYVESVREICDANDIRAIIPGGEGPLALLGPLATQFQQAGVHIAANSPEVIANCSNKKRLFERLQNLGLPMPETVAVKSVDEIENLPCPCVIKPATGTGGSRFVFLASSRDEAKLYARYLLETCGTALVQEYISLTEGEFTIGVLSLPDGRLVGSIAMQRQFDAKLSVSARTETGLISSGYSQGLIDDFAEVRAQAERIATMLDSRGPMNIQGRLRNGTLFLFEINPRFSASTYLRAMAGFNEIDIYLRCVLLGAEPTNPRIRPGYYLRSLSEVYVAKEEVRQ